MRSAVSPNLSMFSSSVKKATQALFLVAPLMLLSACLPEEKEDDDVTETSISALNGFWNGGFEQTETLRVLIYNNNIYGLDADQALFGSVKSPASEELEITLTAYPFAYQDSVNFEYISDRNSTNYSINGLLANETLIVGDYETSNREYGSLQLTNDLSFNSPSSLSSLTGEWTTADIQLNITQNGKFLGVNNGVENDCSFEGEIKLINASQSLLSLTINRKNCDGFNGNSTGYAAINADGELEFYSKMGSSLLFMTFTAPASSNNTTAPEEETPAEQVP